MSKDKSKIKIIKNPDGTVKSIDITNSQKIKKVTGKTGEHGKVGRSGKDGLKGEKGIDGSQGPKGPQGATGKTDTSVNKQVIKNKDDIIATKKEVDLIFGKKQINQENIQILDENLTSHTSREDVHFIDNEKELFKKLLEDGLTQVIQSGNTPSHNYLNGLDGGQEIPKEFYHLNEKYYNDIVEEALLYRDGHLPMTGDLDMDGNVIENVDYIDLVTGNPSNGNPEHKEGRLFYDNTEKTLSFYNDITDVTLNIGEEQWIRVRNETGSVILDGSVVRIMGSSTGLPLVELAKADSPITSESIIGIATHDIEDEGNNGLVTTFGQVHHLDTSICNEGDILYLSCDFAGEWTNVRPAYPNFIIEVGQCTYMDSVNGIIHVNVIGQITDIAINSFNGSILQTINFTISSDGATITGNLDLDTPDPSIEEENLTLMFSDGMTQFVLDGSNNVITLSPGTDSSPSTNLIYIPIDTKELTVSNNWPNTEHIRVATSILRSASTTQTDQALGNRNWNDHIALAGDNGHLLHISSRLRLEHAKWLSGTALSVSGSGTGTIQFDVTSGIVAQLHEQGFPALLMTTGDDIHIVNDSINPYFTTTDLVTDVTLDALGNSIGNNKYFNIVVWGIQNKTNERSHLMLNLPTGSYNGEDSAIADISRFDVFTIPSTPNFIGIGFLISRLTFKMGPGGTTWALVNELDLRGTIPGNAAGSSSSLNITSFSDSSFNVFNVLDDTKIITFDASAITTSTSRTYIFPDTDGILITSNNGSDLSHSNLADLGVDDHSQYWIETATRSADYTTTGLVTAGTLSVTGESTFTDHMTLNQSADDDGLSIYGFDDRNTTHLDLYITEEGFARIDASDQLILRSINSFVALQTGSNDSMFFDAGDDFVWRDFDNPFVIRMTLDSATGDLDITGGLTAGDDATIDGLLTAESALLTNDIGDAKVTHATIVASSTAAKLPGTGENSTALYTGNVAWIDFRDIEADDNNDEATATMLDNESDALYAHNFDFSSIPNDATITNISVTMNRWADDAGRLLDRFVRLTKDGTTSFTNSKEKSTTPGDLWTTNTSGEFTYTGSPASWGGTLTVTEVKNSAFGVWLGVEDDDGDGSTAHVDWMKMTVTYTCPAFWTSGVDKTDGNYKISNSITLGTEDRITIDLDGNTFIDESLTVTGLVTAGSAQFGDVVNYIRISSTGDLTFNGTARFFLPQVDDDAMDATNGTIGEVVFNLNDNTAYVCTITGSPATWAAMN